MNTPLTDPTEENVVRRWRNRVTGFRMVPPEELKANPLNPRIHPLRQQRALEGVLDELGFIDAVIVNETTGHMIDGHLRDELATGHIDEVPVLFVALSEEEERKALATLDPITSLATLDTKLWAELTDGLQFAEAEVNSLIASMSATAEAQGRTALEEPAEGQSAQAPPSFPEMPTENDTQFRCPSCGYGWNGQPK